MLAAANPPSGRYDDLKTAQENIDIQTTMLSRFDLIFIVKDERSFSRDLEIARHIVGVHKRATESSIMDGANRARDKFLKRYIEYCKHKCSPRLTEDTSRVLQVSTLPLPSPPFPSLPLPSPSFSFLPLHHIP